MFISHMIAELPRRINSWSVPVSHCSFICCCFFYFTQILRAVQNLKGQRGAILIGDRSISKKEKGPWEGSTKKWDVCSVRLLLLPFPRCLERFENSLPSSLGPAPTHGYEESRAIKGLCLVDGGKISGSQQKVVMQQMQIWQKKNEKNWHVWQFPCIMISSLRSRRLEVVGTRKKLAREKGTHPSRVSLACARSLIRPLLPSACYAG